MSGEEWNLMSDLVKQSQIATMNFVGPSLFLAGAVAMAEKFAEGQGALRETMEAIRNDLRMLNAMNLADMHEQVSQIVAIERQAP